jgi:hypothetical protein
MNRKIIDYMLIESKDTGHWEFGQYVLRMMEDQWQPLGGIAINNENYIYQVMVKYDN